MFKYGGMKHPNFKIQHPILKPTYIHYITYNPGRPTLLPYQIFKTKNIFTPRAVLFLVLSSPEHKTK